MGTYNYDEKMLIEELTEFLDNIEGDFNGTDLANALEFMKCYAPTLDSSKAFEKMWHKKLHARGIE
jgi:hypothetical protein